MACFITPVTVAIITTSTKKKIPPKYHVEWLNAMLWGGVIMLVVDHIAHGELVWQPPFLTAMKSAAGVTAALKEIVTVGGTMTLAIVATWAAMVFIANTAAKRRQGTRVATPTPAKAP